MQFTTTLLTLASALSVASAAAVAARQTLLVNVDLFSGRDATGTETVLTVPVDTPIALGTNLVNQTQSVEGPVGFITDVYSEFVNGQCSGTLLTAAPGGVIRNYKPVAACILVVQP